jgi:alanine racemase
MTRVREAKKKRRVNRGPIAEIDLSALRHNLRLIRRIVHKKPVIAVVKADAYGHGAVEISKGLIAEGVTHLAVAFTGEAKILREAGINARILVLFDRTGIEDFFDYDLIPVIQDIKSAKAFSKEARRRGTRIPVHIKVDTGMGRIGLAAETAVSDALKIAGMHGIEIGGLLSHFSEADLSDRSFALRQIEIFQKVRSGISEKIGRSLMLHMGNSAAVFSLREAFFDAVRPGISLYGYSPVNKTYGLRPLMTVRTGILVIRKMRAGLPVSYGRTFITKRESKIAVIPVGYADGYNRSFSNNSEALVRGRRVPVVGRVCMDLTMIDVTGIDGVSEGDEVVLLGRQGTSTITARELSSRINTIPYEIITSLGSRARKEYVF